jgi:thymidine kinase
MPISIEKLEKPNWGDVPMNCDSIIDRKLTEQGEMINNAFGKTNFTIIAGPMGSGKTSLCVNLVSRVFRKCFENIYVFIPANSRKSLKNDIFEKYLPENCLYDNLTAEDLHALYDTLKKESAEKHNSLIIIDDFQCLLKDKQIVQVLSKIVTEMRHLRCSIILLQQTFQKLQKSLRELISNIVFFQCGKSQNFKIFNEIMQIPQEQFEQIIDLAFTTPHSWILADLRRRDIYINGGDRIIFE